MPIEADAYSGNVLMISEGEAGVDDVFFLREGKKLLVGFHEPDPGSQAPATRV